MVISCDLVMQLVRLHLLLDHLLYPPLALAPQPKTPQTESFFKGLMCGFNPRKKAEELLPAVEVALGQLGGYLESEERQAIEKVRDAVVSAIASGSGPGLKAAVEELDGATETLAAMLVDLASGALFSD